MADQRRSLGEFTSERAAEDVHPLAGCTFSLDGVVFAFDGEGANMLELSELASTAVTGEEGMSQAALMAGTSVVFKAALGEECTDPDHDDKCPGEYARFAAHVKRHHTPPAAVSGIVQIINEAVQMEMEAETSRPTGRPGSSSSGHTDRDVQLSRLMLSGTGDIAADGQHGQQQPPAPPDGTPTMKLVEVEQEPGDPAQVERAAQDAARREARNAATSVRIKTRKPGGRRTA